MDTNQKHSTSGISTPISWILRVAASVCLSVTLIASGLFMCAVPQATTEMLSRAFSVEANSPFTKDELVAAAIATRDYTVADNDRDALYGVLGTINAQCAADGRSGIGAPDLSAVPDADGRFDADALQLALSEASERYTLDEEALSHLDDVNAVVRTAAIVLSLVAAAAVALLAGCAIKLGRGKTGDVLRVSAAVVMGLFAALAIWVMLDFDGFFAFFHSLFFAEGTWVFSYDSLLITMYPPEFWIGMGAVWLATTLAGCVICLIIGQLLNKHRPSKRNA